MSEYWKVEIHFLGREAAKKFRDALLTINPNFRPLVVPVQSSTPTARNQE